MYRESSREGNQVMQLTLKFEFTHKIFSLLHFFYNRQVKSVIQLSPRGKEFTVRYWSVFISIKVAHWYQQDGGCYWLRVKCLWEWKPTSASLGICRSTENQIRPSHKNPVWFSVCEQFLDWGKCKYETTITKNLKPKSLCHGLLLTQIHKGKEEEEEVNILQCSREEDGSRPAVLAQSGKAESSHTLKTEKPPWHEVRNGPPAPNCNRA